MAAIIDLGEDSDPAFPAVTLRFAGEIGAPLLVIEAAILTPDDAVSYSQRIFAAAAAACRQSRLDVAGHA